MASTPRDRFDDIPADLSRVGAHRAPARRGRGWVAFAWAALATGLLVLGGLYGLSRVNPAISFELPDLGGDAQPTASASAVPIAEPVTDPAAVDPALKLSISILNASPTDGLQDVAGDQLAALKWPNPSRAVATARDEAETVVYFTSTDFEGVAKGLALALGVDPDNVELSDAFFGAPVTIVLGADYVPPTS